MTPTVHPVTVDGVLRDTELPERLAGIGELLVAWRPLWNANSFQHPRLPWEADFPEFSRHLRDLSLPEAETLHGDAASACRFLAKWLPTAIWDRASTIGSWPKRTLRPIPSWLSRDIPGRKWQQIVAFAEAVPDCNLGYLEWCAGKAHLSRCLSQQGDGRRVLALERDSALAGQGERLAARLRLPVEIGICDVMQEPVGQWLRSSRHAVALHACGDLHIRLLRLGTEHGFPAISCAPCCYHLTRGETNPVMSQMGRDQRLVLSRKDLRSAVQETVTAPGHARRQRRRLQSWQLGFDLLQRELRGLDEYLPLPALPAEALNQDFRGFCRRLAASLQLQLPDSIDHAFYEKAGAERFRQVTALDLVRHRFNRLLELWIVCDRALFLVEHGYRVGLASFCEREISPRNLLIQAALPGVATAGLF